VMNNGSRSFETMRLLALNFITIRMI